MEEPGRHADLGLKAAEPARVRPHDLDTLEFGALLAAVARHASSSAGKDACHALRPVIAPDAARDELARVGELTEILASGPIPPGDFPDIRAQIAQARTIGERLSGAELLQIAEILATIGRVRSFLHGPAADRPLLQRSLASLHTFSELERRLAETLDDEGNLRDEASPALRRVRRELRALRAEIETRLGRLFRQSSSERVFAEQYVTLRNGRFVVPVRAQTQSQLPGIVQDRSSSGETLFVEPLFAVDSNNRLLIAAREEAEEESRILQAITEMVGEHADALEEAFDALVDLDTVAARAHFALRHDAVCARIGEPGGSISLRDARHPLLVLTERAVTPIDLELDRGTNLLVLTGPNTGGKSVALKTLGLSVLMTQAGIPILARPGAVLPPFDGVWTDIGDRQNVADDLSTFSGHVRNLTEILAGGTAESLVLLDEPGTGTDPEDGAALARVLLQCLSDRGARVLATTHFQAVKVFALNSPRSAVAAVDFDPHTFSPRYRLVYGSIGPSLGLAMARRLGLPEDLLAAAERERGDLARTLGDAVARLEDERRRYEIASEQIAGEREQLRAQTSEHAALVAELRAKKRKKWADELGEAKRFAEELRSEGRRLLAEARRNPGATARRLHQGAIDQQARIEVRRRLTDDDAVDRPPAPATALSPGDEVEIVGNGVRGRLVKIAGDRAQVARGAVRFDVPAAELRRIGGPARPTREARARHGVQRADRDDVRRGPAAELNLIGSRVEPALQQLEEFLDRASLEDRASVRIVHGHGSGSLRAAIREYLADSSYVTRFEEAAQSAGGSGATIVHLR